ncbi:MAG: WYL domain-containing protein [Rhizobium sp.]|nr:WYL domain-containing protein [Rhizobium sp.]
MNSANDLISDPTRGDTPASTRWGPERRLEFIDFRLRWDGRLNRGDLIAFFGISVPQASLDIAKYLELAPGNVAYDRSLRVYVTTPDFKPLYSSNEPARYLTELLARVTEVLQPELSFIGWAPPVAATPNPTRTLSAEVLIALLGAIRSQTSVKILYQSMSSPEPKERVIAPHALAYDGFRWHVRAYCTTRERFLDFVIARILGIQPTQEQGPGGDADESWHRIIRLVLAPNPLLAKANQRVIELDYGMSDGEVELECRQALLFYALKRLGLSNNDNTTSVVQQIVLKNTAEIQQLLPDATEPR